MSKRKPGGKRTEPPPSVEVETPRGTYVGFRQGGLACFRGVPYARSRRFLGPERIKSYGRVQCTRHGPSSVQPIQFSWTGLVSMLTTGKGSIPEKVPPSQSEDCLNLNLYVPTEDVDGPVPVFVFFHGGGFMYGSNRELVYQHRWGSKLAARQRIAVCLVNYRLGALGFLKVPGGEANVGLRDAVAALRWISEEGARFGLDPAAVTVGGESAGAMLTSCLLRAPAAKGLFRRAIVMSGTELNIIPLHVAERMGQHLASRVDLQGASTMKLLRASSKMVGLHADGWGIMPFQPCLDEDFLVERHCTTGVDVLIGVTQNEALLFTPPLPLGLEKLKIRSDKDVAAAVGPHLANMGGGISRDDVVELVQVATRDYGGVPMDKLRRLLSIVIFEAPLLAMVEDMKDHNSVFVYRNDLGPGHAGEIGYVFGTWNSSVPSRFISGLPVRSTAESNRQGQAMEQQWGAIIQSFVRSGRPSDSWPQYTDSRLAQVIGPPRSDGPKQVQLGTPTVDLVRRWWEKAQQPFGVRPPSKILAKL